MTLDTRQTQEYDSIAATTGVATAWYGGRLGVATQDYSQSVAMGSPAGGLVAGTVIAGRYRVDHYLGGGAFASVYAAWDLRMHRHVAMKVYPSGAGLVPVDEARLQGTVQHPNIMPLYDRCSDPIAGITILVMPLFPGCDLQTLLNSYGALPFRRVLTCMDQICSAVDYLWSRKQIAHGDIKPANIWVTQSGAALLMDFNVPGQLVRQPESRFGTPGYMAPEVLRGQSDARSDVFSLGCLCYACLTGVAPFSVAADSSSGRYVRLSKARHDVRSTLEAVVDKALRADPEARYQSARELRTALRSHRYQSGAGIWDVAADLMFATASAAWRILVFLAVVLARTVRYIVRKPYDAAARAIVGLVVLGWLLPILVSFWLANSIYLSLAASLVAVLSIAIYTMKRRRRYWRGF